jgi:hypothetical protein
MRAIIAATGAALELLTILPYMGSLSMKIRFFHPFKSLSMGCRGASMSMTRPATVITVDGGAAYRR